MIKSKMATKKTNVMITPVKVYNGPTVTRIFNKNNISPIIISHFRWGCGLCKNDNIYSYYTVNAGTQTKRACKKACKIFSLEGLKLNQFSNWILSMGLCTINN